jgi:hypothetical protein
MTRLKYDCSLKTWCDMCSQVKEGVTASQMSEALDVCRQAISNDHGVALQCMVLVKTRTIDKTTSGKIARSWCRRSFLGGSLQTVARWEAPSAGSGDDGEGTMMGVVAAGDMDGNQSGDDGGRGLGDEGVGEGHVEMGGPVSAEDREKFKAMSVAEIEDLLEKRLVQISVNSATGQLPTPVDRNTSMVAMGLESMTMVQFKGVIENR